MRYTKYKTRAKIVLTGDDDLYANNAGSTYKTTGSSYFHFDQPLHRGVTSQLSPHHEGAG